jgi:MSHA biogenesis protein MshI
MHDDINLLNKLGGAQKSKFPASLLINLVLLLIGVLLLLFLLLLLDFYYQSYKLRSVRNEKDRITIELKNNIKKHPIIAQEQSLEKEIASIQKDLATKSKEWENIRLTASKAGFSNTLIALSKHIPKGVWLTNININLQDNSLNLEGKTLNGKLVPIFISNLNKDPQLQKLNLKIKNMQHSSEEKVLTFKVSNI